VLEHLLSRGVSHVIALQYAHKPGISRMLNQYMVKKCMEFPNKVTGLAAVFPGEKDVIEKELKKKERSRRYLFDIKGKVITIWESNQDIEALRDLFRDVQPTSINGLSDDVSKLENIINIAVDYSPIMKFTLKDSKKRLFMAERYCFLGSVDDWIYIGEPDSLKNLVKKYIKHIDQDSFFDLF
jgi:hypothetical protein